MSRGNRQKVALALAFIHRPQLLLLDEPTSGLDPLMQERFHELVQETVADGRTVFLSSHILEEVDHLCDRVGVIRSGSLVTVDKVKDLRRRAGRDIEVRFDRAPDIEPIRRLRDVRDVVLRGETLTLHASGDLDELVKLVAAGHVTDFVSTPPELEQIFLGYYQEAGDDAR
jgi:ABC-2 type transport system ATP-binding protein